MRGNSISSGPVRGDRRGTLPLFATGSWLLSEMTRGHTWNAPRSVARLSRGSESACGEGMNAARPPGVTFALLGKQAVRRGEGEGEKKGHRHSSVQTSIAREGSQGQNHLLARRGGQMGCASRQMPCCQGCGGHTHAHACTRHQEWALLHI